MRLFKHVCIRPQGSFFASCRLTSEASAPPHPLSDLNIYFLPSLHHHFFSGWAKLLHMHFLLLMSLWLNTHAHVHNWRYVLKEKAVKVLFAEFLSIWIMFLHYFAHLDVDVRCVLKPIWAHFHNQKPEFISTAVFWFSVRKTSRKYGTQQQEWVKTERRKCGHVYRDANCITGKFW